MDLQRSLAATLFFLSIAGIFSADYRSAYADSGSGAKNLPLVFDPQTKKYFIGGTSKFMLKQGENSSFIDRIEISVDGGDYGSYGDAVTFKQEGKHTLKFRAVNQVNSWSPVQFVEVFVDLTSPTTEVKFTDDKYFRDEKNEFYVALNSSLTLMAQDNLSGVATIEYSWDGANFTPYKTPIQVGKPGKQTLYYHSIDRVGNMEVARKLEFTADGTAPNSVARLEGPTKPTTINGRTYVSDSLAFAIDATDDASKTKQIMVNLDGKVSQYIKPIYFLSEGPHTLAYYAVDNVGNKETEKTLSVYTVSVPPQTNAVAVGKVVNTGGINFAKNDFGLKLEAKDNVVGLERIEVKVDNEEYRTYLEPLRFKTPGYHTVSYRAIDRAGNVEPTRTYTLNIHETAPDTTIATAQPLVTREGVTYSPSPNVVTFNVGNSSVGVDKTLVSVNDGPYAPYQGPLTLTTEHKTYKISYKSLDKLGNEETPKIANFHMIGTMPVVDLFISNGQSSEEQVRTNYLDSPAAKSSQPARAIAGESEPKPAPVVKPEPAFKPEPAIEPDNEPDTKTRER